ncbi:MAG: TolC family protein [Parvularculaceae bacterium]|nr:TolC family protein [Parvularculaceae bacterium]
MKRSDLSILAPLLFLAPQAAGAQTLSEALDVAYDSNPTIQAERARQRATNEAKAQAWANALPQLSAGANYNKIDRIRPSTAPRLAASARRPGRSIWKPRRCRSPANSRYSRASEIITPFGRLARVCRPGRRN